MEKSYTFPKFRPGDFVGFKNGENGFVITTVEYCSFGLGSWRYALNGWHSAFQEKDLINFKHIVPGESFIVKD
jgi:hypothetical protein